MSNFMRKNPEREAKPKMKKKMRKKVKNLSSASGEIKRRRGRGGSFLEFPVRNAFFMFLRDIAKYPLLSVEEERRLARRAKNRKDEDAAKKIVLSNLKFVVKIALEYRNWGVPLEDLVSEGVLGLIFAVKKFDPQRGVKFISYASYWVRAFIHNYILANFSIVKMGTTQDERRIFANIFKIREDTKDEDIRKQAERLGVTEDKIRFMDRRVHSRDLSLDSPQDEEGSLRLADVLRTEDGDPLDRIAYDEQKSAAQRIIKEVLSKLSSYEYKVVSERYLSDKPKTLKALSTEMDISKERIRQLEKRAVSKIRSHLAPHLDLIFGSTSPQK